jgi:hypothetical protein
MKRVGTATVGVVGASFAGGYVLTGHILDKRLDKRLSLQIKEVDEKLQNVRKEMEERLDAKQCNKDE